eukprot:scaffold7025_cov123-Cylindrotheca_fusiformis.AAC.8
MDEMHAVFEKNVGSLISDDDASRDSTTASLSSSESSENLNALDTSTAVGIRSEGKSKEDGFGFSLVDTMCADAMCSSKNETDAEFRSLADTTASDSSERYTSFPKKQYRNNFYYGGCSSEQSAPSAILDFVDAWRDWMTDGERAVQKFLDGPSTPDRSQNSNDRDSTNPQSISEKAH